MFLNHFGLREQPFGVTPDPYFLYVSAGHQEALASLYYGLKADRGFLALIAKPGMGKSTLLVHLLQKVVNAKTAFLFQTQCGRSEFMRLLMGELGFDSRETDFVRMHEQFNDLLAQEARASRRVLLVVDEAQNLSDEVLETIRLLSDFETPRAKLLQIILAGQPPLADKLANLSLYQLRQRVSVIAKLEPLKPQEVSAYVNHRLRVAGYAGERLFTPQAITELAHYSEGIPRNINNLCFHAMSMAYAESSQTVDAAIISEVAADLDLNAAAQVGAAGASQKTAAGGKTEVADSNISLRLSLAVPLEQARTSLEKPDAEQNPELEPGPADTSEAGPRGIYAAPLDLKITAPLRPRPTTTGQPAIAPVAVVAAAPEKDTRVPPIETGPRVTAIVGPPAVAPVAVVAAAPKKDTRVPPIETRPRVAAVAEPISRGAGTSANQQLVAGSNALQSARPVPQEHRAPVVKHEITAKAAALGPTLIATQPARPAPEKHSGYTPSRKAAVGTVLKTLERSRRKILTTAVLVLLGVALINFLTKVPMPTQSTRVATPTVQPAPFQQKQTPPKAHSAKREQGPTAPGPRKAAVKPANLIAKNPKVMVAGASLTPPQEQDVHPGDRLIVNFDPRTANEAATSSGRAPGFAEGRLLFQTMPLYPKEARDAGIEGQVVLSFRTNSDGTVEHARVVRGHWLLARSAMEALMQWKYQPSYLNGQAASVQRTVLFRFSLR